jgi:septum site-determining protein MinD
VPGKARAWLVLASEREVRMAKVIVITSGKGGVGKTTTSASIAAGMALQGFKTVAIDFDVGLRNLDLIMGVERRVVYDLVNVVKGEASLRQALIRDKRLENLHVLPASQTRDKEALDLKGVGRVIDELKELGFDYIFCDSPAGIEKGAQMAMYFADEAIVVTNPEVSSVRDSDRVLGLLDAKTRKAELGVPMKSHLLVTRYSADRAARGEMLKVEDIIELLGIGFLGVIPESKSVLNNSNQGTPVVLDKESDAAAAYLDAIKRLLGEEQPHRFLTTEKKGFFSRLFAPSNAYAG